MTKESADVNCRNGSLEQSALSDRGVQSRQWGARFNDGLKQAKSMLQDESRGRNLSFQPGLRPQIEGDGTKVIAGKTEKLWDAQSRGTMYVSDFYCSGHVKRQLHLST